MTTIPFTKMHGLGNDFVVIDTRHHHLAHLMIGEAAARVIADRHTGVGCDQLILIEKPLRDGTDAFMRIRNADGGEVGACGNATRCVAALLMAEGGRDSIHIETAAGILEAEQMKDGTVEVDMGPARLDWRDIPLAEPQDTLHLELAAGPLKDPVAVSMGNPHAVFFVADAEAIDVATLGPELEHHSLFPERANIGVAQVVDKATIRLRVWERGAGITQACGTGACAAAVAAVRRGLCGRNVTVQLDGGPLGIEWRGDDHVLMTGPVAVSFTGSFDERLIA